MNIENKMLFWKIVNEVIGVSDIVVKYENGTLIANGAGLERGSILFEYETEKLRIFNNDNELLI